MTSAPSTSRLGADVLAASLMFMFVLAAITLSMMPIVTNQLRTEIGLRDAQIGLLTSVFMGFYGVSGLLSGIAADRWGGRLLGVSCACFALGSVVFALSSGFAGFLVGRAVQGIGGGMVVATCNPVLSCAVQPDRLGRAWGITGIGFGVGSLVALFGLPGIQAAGGYRAVFLTTAALAVVIAAGILAQRPVRRLPPQDETNVGALARALGSVLKNRRVLLLGLCNAAGLSMGVAILAWAPLYFQDIYGASETTSVYVIAALGAAQIVGNPLGVVAAARFGPFPVLVGGVAASIVTTVLIGLVPGIGLGALMVILSNFFGMLFFPVMMFYIPRVVRSPGQVGPATGMNSAMGFIGSLFAPWLFGLILDAGGQSRTAYLAGFLVLGVIGAIALAGLAFFRPGSVGKPVQPRV
jgi:predicted MFS family arabinose efflux permease